MAVAPPKKSGGHWWSSSDVLNPKYPLGCKSTSCTFCWSWPSSVKAGHRSFLSILDSYNVDCFEPKHWQLHIIKGPFGGSLVFSGDPAPPLDDAGRRSRGPSPGPPLSRTAPGRLEQLDQEDDEDHTHLKKVQPVCCLAVKRTFHQICESFSSMFHLHD